MKWKTFFLVSQALSFRFKKQTSKNLADTTFKRNNDKIWMDIYYKSISSNHPNHYKKNITFTRRVCTIVEDTEAKTRHLENLKSELQKIWVWYQKSFEYIFIRIAYT